MKTSSALNPFFSRLSLTSVNTHVTSSLSVTIAETSNIAKTESIPSQVTVRDFSCAPTASNGKISIALMTSFLTKMKAFVIGHKMWMRSVTVSPQIQLRLQLKRQLLSPVKTEFTRMRLTVINFINAHTDTDGPIRNVLNLSFFRLKQTAVSTPLRLIVLLKNLFAKTVSTRFLVCARLFICVLMVSGGKNNSAPKVKSSIPPKKSVIGQAMLTGPVEIACSNA